MSYRVTVRQQIWDYYHQLGPAERRAIKAGLKGLANEKGDLRALRERLDGYYRLRVGCYRIIFRYRRSCIIECVYINARALVYDVFESELQRVAGEKEDRAK